jgi:hypothetical protein
MVLMAHLERAGKTMRLFFLAGLLITSGCWAQEQASAQERLLKQAQEQAPPAAQKETLTIPSGTRVPLTLTNPIRTRSARPGDSIRAVTTFPVTVGTQEVIPLGTYVEGSLRKVLKRDSAGHPGLLIHFTRMVFANGYAVALEGAMAQTMTGSPGASSPETSTSESRSAASSGLGFQQTPGPPPLPMPVPRIGTAVGIAAGTAAAGIVALVLWGRHRGVDTLFDTGWQCEMILESPLWLDANRVAAAIAGPSAQ